MQPQQKVKTTKTTLEQLYDFALKRNCTFDIIDKISNEEHAMLREVAILLGDTPGLVPTEEGPIWETCPEIRDVYNQIVWKIQRKIPREKILSRLAADVEILGSTAD